MYRLGVIVDIAIKTLFNQQAKRHASPTCTAAVPTFHKEWDTAV